MTDTAGISFFLKALCELARGGHVPSVLRVWDRHLLTSRNPPCVTHVHREYEEKEVVEEEEEEDEGDLVTRTFFFGNSEISAIRRLLLPAGHESTTTLEALTAFLWRCRTVALSPNPNVEMRLACAIYARAKLRNPPIPPGYYGNVSFFPVAIETAKDLMEKPLDFALRLIKHAMSSVTEDVRSVTDLMVTRGQPKFVTAWIYLVTDFRRFDFGSIDFGPWGEPVYGGTARAGSTEFSGAIFCMLLKNKKGETGILVPVCLPVMAMERFVQELESVLSGRTNNPNKLIMSSI